MFGTECRALLDRNIVTRLVNLTERRDPTPHDRLAAAALCFAQCADVLIDPGLALHEYAAFDGGSAAAAEADPIQVLDNVAPHFLAEIALGRRKRIPSAELRRAREAVAALGHSSVAPGRLEQPLRDFRVNYTILLRIAALDLAAMPPVRRAAALLDWVHDEFQWSSVALWFGLRYFAPKLPATGWLPGLRSADSATALARLRNVAWDLTLVSTWLARKEERDRNVIWLLCSSDHAVIEVARGVLKPESDADDVGDEHLPRLLQKQYGSHDGKRLAQQYAALLSRRRDPQRAYNRCRGQFPEDLRTRLEREVIAAVPRRGSR
jgi:hypothetical protein